MPRAEHSDIPVTPSDVACIELVNSRFTHYLGSGESTDRITSETWQAWFLERYGLTLDAPAAAPVEDLIALRQDLHRILDKWSRHVRLTSRDLRPLDTRVQAATVRRRVTSTSAGFELVQEPLRRDWTWVVSEVAASAVDLMRTGDPKRLKTCDNPACSWVFYDTSVNHSKRYCTATPCGSLMRVRRFRQSL